MARYSLSGGARRASFMSGLSSGFINAKYNRQQNELEQQKIENEKKSLEINSQQLAASLAANQQTNAWRAATLEAENFEPNSYNFFTFKPNGKLDKNLNQKFNATSKLFQLPKGEQNEHASLKAARHFNFINNKIIAGDKEFLYALKEQPEQALKMLSEIYTIGASGEDTKGVGEEDKLVKNRRLLILPEMQKDYTSMFENVAGLKEYIVDLNKEVGMVLPKNADGKLTYQTATLEDGTPIVQILGLPGSKLTVDGKIIDNLNEITDGKLVGEDNIAYQTVNEAVSLMTMLDQSVNVDQAARKGASFIFSNKDYFKFNELAKVIHTKSSKDEQIENLMKSFMLHNQTVEHSSDLHVNTLEKRKAFSRSVVLATAIAKYGTTVFNVKRVGNGQVEVSLDEQRYHQRISKKDRNRLESEVDAADKFVNSSSDLLTKQNQIRTLSKEAHGNEFIFSLGQKVTGGIFDWVYVAGETLDNVVKQLGIDDEIKEILGQKEVDNFNSIFLTGDSLVEGEGVTSAFKDNIRGIQTLYSNNMEDNIKAYKKGAFHTNAEINKEIFLLRAEAESLKVRMAFQAASLVQGGGTGGGRTISNADFEFLYKSLFSSGTGEGFERVILTARNELAKAGERARIAQNYGHLGIHRELMRTSDIMMDAGFAKTIKTKSGIDFEYLEGRPLSEQNLNPAQNFPELGDLLNIDEKTLTDEYGLQRQELIDLINSRNYQGLTNLYLDKLIPFLHKSLPVKKPNMHKTRYPEAILKMLTADTGYYDNEFVVGIGLNEQIAKGLTDKYFESIKGKEEDWTTSFSGAEDEFDKSPPKAKPIEEIATNLFITDDQITTQPAGHGVGKTLTLNDVQLKEAKELLTKLYEEIRALPKTQEKTLFGTRSYPTYEGKQLYDLNDYLRPRLKEVFGDQLDDPIIYESFLREVKKSK